MTAWPSRNQLIQAAEALRAFAALIEARGEEASRNAHDFLGGYPQQSTGGGAGTSYTTDGRQCTIVEAGRAHTVDNVWRRVDAAWAELAQIDRLIRSATSSLATALPLAHTPGRRSSVEPCLICSDPAVPSRYGLDPKCATRWQRWLAQHPGADRGAWIAKQRREREGVES